MNYWHTLNQTIQRTLATNRIGAPVFLRCTIVVNENDIAETTTVQYVVAAVLSMTNDWFGATPAQHYAASSTQPKANHMTITAEYATGVMALLTVSILPTPTHIDLTLLGTTGDIYQKAFIQPLRDGSLDVEAVDAAVVDAVDKALSVERQNLAVADRQDAYATTDRQDACVTVPLGVLLVSGHRTHQENYATNFAADPRCQVLALTDEAEIPTERVAWNQSFADELSIPYIADVDEALADERVDIVSICAEPERRARIAAKCAAAGKHIYLDKPMTPFVDGGNQVAAAVAASGVCSQMFSFWHQSWLARAKSVLASGALGELVSIHADCLFAKGPTHEPESRAVLGTPRQAEYPPIIANFVDAKAELYAMGVYALASVLSLTGCAVQSVYGRTANYFFAAHQQRNMEDFGFLVMTLERGITATITGGRIGWTGHGSGGSNQIYLIGTKGAMLIDAYAPRIEVYDTASPWTPPAVHPGDPMGFWSSTQAEVDTQPKRVYTPLSNAISARSDESHFVDCVLEGREAEVNAEKAAMLTKVLLAGYESAATGEVMRLS